MLSYRVERDRDRELQKTIAVYSESPSEKSISSLLVFDWVTIAADQEKNQLQNITSVVLLQQCLYILYKLLVYLLSSLYLGEEKL